MHFLSTKAPRSYTEAAYGPDDFLIFGRETRGLPESLLSRVYDRCLRIPMVPGARSLNLSNSVAIVLYEALRTLNFPGMQEAGELTGREVKARHGWITYNDSLTSGTENTSPSKGGTSDGRSNQTVSARAGGRAHGA